jgi:O-methyltransferase
MMGDLMGDSKRHINAFLPRTTGYRVVNAGRPAHTALTKMGLEVERLTDVTRRQETVAALLESLASRVAPDDEKPQQQSKTGAGPGKTGAAPAKGFPPDFDKELTEIIKAVKPYTMTSNDKLHALISATRYVHQQEIDGAVVECGVWRGGSMHAVARTLDSYGDHSRDLYLFDTFEGMPPPSEKDRRHDGRTAETLLKQAKSDEDWVLAIASLEDVKAGFKKVPYPSERVHYVPGMVEDTIPQQAPEKISILRLDTDWYASTKHELEQLYPRLVSGGVLIIDDYGWWQGSREATEEFLSKSGERLLLTRAGTGRVGVKP